MLHTSHPASLPRASDHHHRGVHRGPCALSPCPHPTRQHSLLLAHSTAHMLSFSSSSSITSSSSSGREPGPISSSRATGLLLLPSTHSRCGCGSSSSSSSSSSGSHGRRQAHVCAAKKANSSGATKAKKKAGPPTLTVRIAEEMLVNGDEGALGNNIVAAGALSSARQHRALVLDSAYRPIHVWPWHKAVSNEVLQKCSVLVHYPPPAVAWSGQGPHPLPAVVRVDNYVDLNNLCKNVTCTARNVLMRDQFTCQYCGSKSHLTLDHVVPTSKGGKSNWRNLVTACMSCNQRKGNKLLSQIGWKLKTPPKEPRPWEVGFVAGLRLRDLVHPPELWTLFLEPYRARMGGLLEHMTSPSVNLKDDAEVKELFD